MTRAEGDVSITITELRRHFHRILREVERGSTFTVVRRGLAVARLVGLVPHIQLGRLWRGAVRLRA